ncbi:MAG: hypothetical protein N3G20_05855, partial [Verrucomicrobiae bacterium]|nr:hypothetical protein [Verrucomicrobiae bacterium]
MHAKSTRPRRRRADGSRPVDFSLIGAPECAQVHPKARKWLLATLALLLGGTAVCIGMLVFSSTFGLVIAFAALALGAAVVQSPSDRKVKVSIERDSEGKPRRFVLAIGRESVRAEPGNTWLQTDHFKWVTRGLMEAPQSFRVFSDGTVEINGEKIRLTDPDACERFEYELNKKFTSAITEHKPVQPRQTATATQPPPDKVIFTVRLDHLGHLAVECRKGEEKIETGLRGLTGLVENGLMLRPKSIHVHPLQQWVEIDGVRYECTAEGARALQEALNAHYAPKISSQHAAIEIRENPAAATGFDIRFFVTRAGARFEIKGHLCQEHLDLLQDQSRCDLLKPGIVVKLAPPYLIIRRKRPDGGEEPIPELPDVQYRRITAAQLEQILNHPLIRRGGAVSSAEPETQGKAPEFASIRITRNAASRPFLCLECVPAHGGNPVTRALTHQNVHDLQHAGVFLPHLEVSLSLDNRTLKILNKETGQEERFQVNTDSSDEELERASRALSLALKPPTPAQPKQPSSEPSPQPAVAVPDARNPVEQAKPLTEAPPDQKEPHITQQSSFPAKQPETQIIPGPIVPQHGQPENKRISHSGLVPECQPNAKLAPREAEAEKTPVGTNATFDPRPTLEVPAVTTGLRTVSQTPGRADNPTISLPQKSDPSPHHHQVSPPASAHESHPLAALFGKADPNQVATQIFKSLVAWFGVRSEEKYLSLPRVFENRRFEIINFSGVLL